jgi:hypothetical protein
MILAVDLAAKFSAGLIRGRDGQVHCEFDTLGRGPRESAMLIAETASLFGVTLILIEDVPYGISKQFMVKPVLRLQGRVIQAIEDAGLPAPYFVAPATWQRAMNVWRVSPEQTAAVAAEHGYTPPNLLETHAHEIPEKGPERSKIRALLKKSATDYVDAYLLSEWAGAMAEDFDLSQIQGVQVP